MKKMNATHCGLGLLVLGILGITVSCGGTDDPADSNNGGTNGTPAAGTSSSGGSAGSSSSGGGTNTAGSSSNGGSNNNSAGDGPGNQGGNDFGNNGGQGFGFGGNPFNFGGAGNDPDCPAAKPDSGGDCAASGGGRLQCAYGESACFCAQNDQWFCIGGGGDNCPAEKPANMSPCTTQGDVCPYDNGGCACFNDMWNCN